MRRRKKRVRVESDMLSKLHEEIAQLRATVSDLQGVSIVPNSTPAGCTQGICQWYMPMERYNEDRNDQIKSSSRNAVGLSTVRIFTTDNEAAMSNSIKELFPDSGMPVTFTFAKLEL